MPSKVATISSCLLSGISLNERTCSRSMRGGATAQSGAQSQEHYQDNGLTFLKALSKLGQLALNLLRKFGSMSMALPYR